jgi:hypothetical protein
MTKRFDARAYWAGLTAEQQRTFGEAFVLWFFARVAETDYVGDQLSDAAKLRWEHAGFTALTLMDPPDPGQKRVLEGPDLAVLGIRACRVCGCTDESACTDGCYWVAEDLCSTCSRATGHA